uniref:D-xylose ABC transporter ATP-binding protein n=1 Tax=Agrobacterium vitis TaxID=373 RepID=A0A2Z2Q453_AGRVI|nr:D-xylose ABC transporter ATP-binding protein [Agrobacterium vitis]
MPHFDRCPVNVTVPQRHIHDLELRQDRYEASLAERRYAACDPDNRLIAAQLEKNWETALRRVRDLEVRKPADCPSTIEVDPGNFVNLADNLQAASSTPDVTMRVRQQLLRTLIADIVVDVDDAVRDVVLTIHWKGGQHSELRVRKPQSGEHGCATTEDALAVMRSMAGRWSDEHIAASLNRMGMPTGQGKTWTAHRVASVRRVRAIHAYKSADKDGDWLTMTEAAAALGVTNHRIRHLIKRVLSAEQVVPGAPYQIRASDLNSANVRAAIVRKGRPCRIADAETIPMFTDT